MTFYINNKRSNGYQPTDRPENLTPPNKGPSYCPKEKETKVKWHPYPEEKPLVKDNDKVEDYLVTIRFKKEKFVINASFSPYYKQFYKEYMISDLDKFVTAWAELPEPYKESI